MASTGNLQWSCSICTLLNHVDNNLCVVCGAPRNQSGDMSQEIAASQKNLLQSLAPSKPSQPSQPSQSQQNNNNKDVNKNSNKQNDDHKDSNDKSNEMELEEEYEEYEEYEDEDGDAIDENMDENEVDNEFLDENANEEDGDFDDGEFEDDDGGFDDADGDGWGDEDDLCYDEQKKIDIMEEEDNQAMLKRAMEKRRLAQSKLEAFWKCGKCQFLNHPSRAVCMMCSMPQLDVVHHIMMCPKADLRTCPRCHAYVVPHLYDDHVLDCKPIGALDNAKANQAWYCKLTPCEQAAINHVNGLAIKKSEDAKQKLKLITLIKQIDNGKYVSTIDNTLKALYHFLEWEVPIIIRIHIADLIPKIMNDTHYRNLFEIGKGSGGNDQNVRKTEEGKMFGPVYDKAKAFERPKYGCLNIGLTDAGTQQAVNYGDGYFLMNDTTVRWRTTLTVMDSFSVNGECGTVKHCNHLLTQLQPTELAEIIEAALYKKTTSGGSKQGAYREIQIHGPVQLNRDVLSVHVPSHHKKNKKLVNTLERYCAKNMCKLVYFDMPGQNNGYNNGYNNY